MFTAIHQTENIIEIDTMPEPSRLPDGTMYGYYSVTLPNKIKLVPYHHIRNFQERYETETGFTRQFLKTLPKRKIRQEEYINYRMTRPPLLIKPRIIKDAVYIDLKAAFPSIYKKIGWMTDYVRGKYWGVGEFLDYPYPMTWKAGRSFVISGARHRQFGRHVKNGKVVTKPYASPFSNPPLVAGVYDVLSMIARFSEYALHAAYWNVDGGIFPAKAVDIFLPFVESIGLEAKVKYSGNATILSSGYWKVGAHETTNYAKNKSSAIRWGDYIPVTKDEAEWIYSRFRTIAERKS